MRASVLVPSVLASFVLVAPSHAAAPPPASLTYQSLTIARVNPLGLFELAEMGYRLRLYDSDSAALEDNFVQVGARIILTPGLGRAAAMVRVQPASVLQLWAEYEVGGFFGNFGMLQSFTDAGADASDSRLDALEADGRNYATTNSQLAFGAKLQAKVGPVAARSTARFIRPDVDLRDGDVAYYDIAYDLVIPDETWAVNVDTDLLWVSDFGLAAGLRWTYTDAFSAPDSARPLHRLGPLFAYTFWDEPGATFNQPTAILIANWWLEHPYRTGADTSRGVPFVIAGFRFSGDLWVQD